AIRAAGDGQAAAREIAHAAALDENEVRERVRAADAYSRLAGAEARIVEKVELAGGIVEFTVYAPLVARSARPGQFVRVLGWPKGELIPLTLADWDADAGTITLVVQRVGKSSIEMNRMRVGDAFTGIAGPLGLPSELHRHGPDETVVFTAGGLGLPPVHPIAREHLRQGNHVTLISGFRTESLQFWTGEEDRLARLKAEFGDQLDIVLTTDDGSFGIKGFVTTPLEAMLEANQRGEGRRVAEVVTIGPPLMMRAVSSLTRRFGVHTVASLNSIMVDATGMCGACMVPVTIDGKLVRKHACIDGPELDAHAIDWDKFLPRFTQFRAQEQRAIAAADL
ncbi:MAG: sulfide/dihydroorotate dehydrogenase-like FAD/NAD-binding protein, partial [Actinobacteria bacterium]|nr:sulfide/dihydroorotate dehydrogenase-like FAD/NAD-binding protein [Actinomycetota bacterium]